jgi:hypothetical protein
VDSLWVFQPLKKLEDGGDVMMPGCSGDGSSKRTLNELEALKLCGIEV